MDYTVYVSRCFGYCFLVGHTFEDEDDEPREFINFYPSIHHYHASVAFNEETLWQPFSGGIDWYPRDYPNLINGVEIDEDSSPDIASDIAGEAMEGVQATISQVWHDEAVDLGDLLTSEDEND